MIFVGKVQPKLAKERAQTSFHSLRTEKLPPVWKKMSDELKLPVVDEL